jgi:glutathione reductase (NADPH)
MVELLVEASREEGIEVDTNVQIASVDRSPSGGIRVVTTQGGALLVDLVVHGAGRSPDIQGLNPEAGASPPPRGESPLMRGCALPIPVFSQSAT